MFVSPTLSVNLVTDGICTMCDNHSACDCNRVESKKKSVT